MFNRAANVEFCTATVASDDGEACFCVAEEATLLLPTRAVLDELKSRELPEVTEPLVANCSSRSMSWMKSNIRGSSVNKPGARQVHVQVMLLHATRYL